MTDSLPRYHDESDTEIEGYRPLDPRVVIALVAALGSPLTLLQPAFAILGVVAVGVGLAAIVRARRQSPPSGTRLATFSVAVAAFVSSWGVTEHIAARAHITAEADARFRTWVSLLGEGKRYEAFELHRQYSNRQLPGTSLEAIYTQDVRLGAEPTEDEKNLMMSAMSSMSLSPKQEFDTFFADDPAKTLAAHAADGQLELIGLEKLLWGQRDTDVVLRYVMRYQDGSVRRELPFLVSFVRSRYQGGEYHWVVDQVVRPPRGD